MKQSTFFIIIILGMFGAGFSLMKSSNTQKEPYSKLHEDLVHKILDGEEIPLKDAHWFTSGVAFPQIWRAFEDGEVILTATQKQNLDLILERRNVGQDLKVKISFSNPPQPQQ